MVHKFKILSCIVCCVLTTTFTILTNAESKRIEASDCPVCFRVITASIEYGKTMKDDISQRSKISVTDLGESAASKAFQKYCDLESSLEVEEQQFCYNVGNVRNEIYRLLDMKASVKRICNKVKSMNPDFCASKYSKTSIQTELGLVHGLQRNNRLQRGIIYI